MPPPKRRRFQLPWRSARSIQADVDEELRFDLDMRAAELERDGLSPADALAQATVEFGDLEQTRRYCADQDRDAQRAGQRLEWLAELRQDVHFAWRGMRRSPGFVLVVLATLALGIGANTAAFSIVRKALLDRLPYRDADRVVSLSGGTARDPRAGRMVTPAEIVDLRGSRAFAGVAAFGWYGGMTFVGGDGAEVWGSVEVDGDFFRVLGVTPLLGRAIDPHDAEPGAPAVVVLSYPLWQRAFGRDSTVVGRPVQLNGTARTIVGVMRPDFVFPERSPEMYLPMDFARLTRNPVMARRSRALRAVARLADGVTAEGVEAELARLAANVRRDFPELNDVAPVNIKPIHDVIVGDVRPVLLAVMGSAALVLLLTCVNVASLFLSRSTERSRELAVRAALGAGRGRLVRQLLTESTMIALAGGALGLALATWGKHVLGQAARLLLPSLGEVRIDFGILAFAAATSLASVIAFGLLPAISGTRFDVKAALSESSRGATRRRTVARRVLVGAQLALAVVLLIGAGLLGRTLLELNRTGVGYETDARILTFRVNLSSARYPGPIEQREFWNGFLSSLRAAPSVQSAGAVVVSPWNGYTSVGPDSLHVEDGPGGAAIQTMAARVVASDGYFTALGIPVNRGRPFEPSDRDGAMRVAVINESLARDLWPGADPIGRRVRLGRATAPWLSIVGVVGDVRPSPSADVEPTVYVAMAQESGLGGADVVVRASGGGGDASSLVPAIRQQLRTLDPRLPLVGARTMSEVFGNMLAAPRLPLFFIAAFAILSLILAVVGVYSVMAFSVAARQREFGIRTALGAHPANVLSLVMRDGMTTALIGTSVGLVVAFLSSSILRALLFGVTARDPVVFVATPLAIIVVSAVACLVPARRATAVDPVEVLRAD
jgi:putative ABC transport system permease protein